MPEIICLPCAKSVVDMYHFKQNCEKADEALRNHFGKSPPPHEEEEQQVAMETHHDEEEKAPGIKEHVNLEGENENQQDVKDDGQNEEYLKEGMKGYEFETVPEGEKFNVYIHSVF